MSLLLEQSIILFIVGNYEDWRHEACSSQLIHDDMTIYNKSMDEIRANTPLLLDKIILVMFGAVISPLNNNNILRVFRLQNVSGIL
ncbi:hypothetical protein ACFL53_03870 [Pseudomonadota bacterium]